MQSKVKGTVTILGAGSFGTSLAIHLARQNYHVYLWARDLEVSKAINTKHRNPKYLEHIDLPLEIEAFSDLTHAKAFTDTEMIVFALPTQFLRPLVQGIKGHIGKNKLLVSVAKGIEIKTDCFPSQIIEQELGPDLSSSLAVLSGPSFAIEIAEGQPTGIAVASKNITAAKKMQEIFHSPLFRVYTNNDPIGLELAGALKNVISLAAGACTGLGFQNNSMATLITRGLSEMTRIGVMLGANPLTFNGLGGVGDLILSCSSKKSRNFSVGYRLGKGESLEQILSSLHEVAEGVTTTYSAYSLCKNLGARAPIITSVYQVFYEKKPLKEAVVELTNSDAKDELEFITSNYQPQKTN
jgi:glycerol-3-phosphate dehydrogenase (NAD(P)+)